jgi:hypothetical protein
MNSPPEKSPWRQALLPVGATIQQAIESLDRSGLQIVLMVKELDILFGTLTDGDIRRALLKGMASQSQAHEIAHRNPLVSPIAFVLEQSSNRAIEETNRNIKFLNEQIEKTRIVEVQRKRSVITRVLESSIGPGPSRSAAAMRWCFP